MKSDAIYELDELCAYCRTELGETKDHVFPRSWYPETTPQNMQKWTVPACEPCNNSKAALEGLVRTWLSATVDPNKDEAKGVWDKSFRSIDPTTSKSDRDREAKANARNKLVSRFTRPSSMASEDAAGLLDVAGDSAADAAIRVDNGKVDQLLKLFALGCFRYLLGNSLNLGSEIDIYLAHKPEQVKLFAQNVERSGIIENIGPGFEVSLMFPGTCANLYHLLLIKIWGSVRVVAILIEKKPCNSILTQKLN